MAAAVRGCREQRREGAGVVTEGVGSVVKVGVVGVSSRSVRTTALSG